MPTFFRIVAFAFAFEKICCSVCIAEDRIGCRRVVAFKEVRFGPVLAGTQEASQKSASKTTTRHVYRLPVLFSGTCIENITHL